MDNIQYNTKKHKLCKDQIDALQEIIASKIEICYVFADGLLTTKELHQKYIENVLRLTCEALIQYMNTYSSKLNLQTNDLIQAYYSCFEAIMAVKNKKDRSHKFDVLLSLIKKFTVISGTYEVELLETEVIEARNEVISEVKITKELEYGTYKRTA